MKDPAPTEPNLAEQSPLGPTPIDDLLLENMPGIGSSVAGVLRRAGVADLRDLGRAHPNWIASLVRNAGIPLPVNRPREWRREARTMIAARDRSS